VFKGNGVNRKGTPVGEDNEGSPGRGGTRVKKQLTGECTGDVKISSGRHALERKDDFPRRPDVSLFCFGKNGRQIPIKRLCFEAKADLWPG
jgi:hypothetical protein